MSFLHPWALGLAALVAVPVLLHLRRREPRRRVSFPALRYLRRAREAHARSLRTGDLLLLAARAALLLAVVLAAAGPLVGRGSAEHHRPTDVVLVIDNSASASRLAGSDETVLDRFVHAATAALEAAGPEDRFWVVPALGDPPALGVPAERARAALEAVLPADGGAAIPALVRAARAMLPGGPGRARELHLLSDLQATAFPPAPGDPAPWDATLLAYRPPTVPPSNGAVTDLELTEGTAVPAGRSQSVVVEIRRHAPGDASPEPAPPARLRLELDGRTAGLSPTPWGASAVFRLPELAPGIHAGKAEVEPDGIRADDARHFTLRVFPPPAVAHRGPPGSFVGVALETLRAAGRLGEPGAAAVRILEGDGRAEAAAAFPDAAEGPDPARVEAGTTWILIPPADPLHLPGFNQLLRQRRVPWRLLPDTAAGELRLAGDAGLPGLARARVLRRHLLAAEPGAAADTSLLRTEDGMPWLVRGRSGGVHLVLASPLVPEASTIPASPAMVPFVEALVLRWSAGGGWPDRGFEAGRPLRLPALADSVRLPGGRVVGVEGGAPFTPLRAGVYDVFAGDGVAARFAANVPAEESDLAPLPEGSLQELFGGAEVVIAGPDPMDWRRSAFRDRRGAPAAPWLLLLALALVAAEAVLATPGRAADEGRAREPGPGRRRPGRGGEAGSRPPPTAAGPPSS